MGCLVTAGIKEVYLGDVYGTRACLKTCSSAYTVGIKRASGTSFSMRPRPLLDTGERGDHPELTPVPPTAERGASATSF